jgi:hypothetical protein
MPPIAAMICGRWLRGSGAGRPSQCLHQIADEFLRPTGDLAESAEPAVGAYLDEDQLRAVRAFMCGPGWLVKVDGKWVGDDVDDLHVAFPARGPRSAPHS